VVAGNIRTASPTV